MIRRANRAPCERLWHRWWSRRQALQTALPLPVALLTREAIGQPIPTGPYAEAILPSGAIGDGRADDTKAVQSAISRAAVPGAEKLVVLPAGRYYLTDCLRIPGNLSGFGIQGLGSVTMIQSVDNLPILEFQGPSSRHLTIAGLAFTYAAAQTPAHSASVAISAGGSSHDGVYNSHFSSLRFSNCFRCLSGPSESNARYGYWGCQFDRLYADASVTGALIALDCQQAVGWPNNVIRSVYGRCDSMQEPMLLLRNQTGIHLQNIEGNILSHGLIACYGCRLVSLESGRAEGFGRIEAQSILGFYHTQARVCAFEAQISVRFNHLADQLPVLVTASNNSFVDGTALSIITSSGRPASSVHIRRDRSSSISLSMYSGTRIVQEIIS